MATRGASLGIEALLPFRVFVGLIPHVPRPVLCDVEQQPRRKRAYWIVWVS